MTDAPVLAVENLSKLYGKKEAVSGVSFNVAQSELIGLLGPNGAGKSTTLRMIAGSLAPASGSVRICGCDIQEQPAFAKSRIGYLPEVPPLYPEMTVSEYLSFARGLKSSGGNKQGDDSAWMESLTRDLNIENKMSTLIRNLSKGYRQRVGIAAPLRASRPFCCLTRRFQALTRARQLNSVHCSGAFQRIWRLLFHPITFTRQHPFAPESS